MTQVPKRRGFTLVELIVVIAILAIIAAATTLVVNPSEMLKRGRDGQRISDLNQLSLAITSYVNSTTTPNMDNSSNINCADGSNPKIFVSIPSTIATTSAPGLPSGWNYGQATLGSYRNTDATGWVPINFNGLAGGSPLPTLPVDPINAWSSSQNYFYAYICKSNGQYELETYLESKNYSFGGPQDKTSTDGGRDPYMFETGSNFSLSPLSPVGAWLMDEGSGSYAYDTSGNNNTGTLTGTTTWQTASSCKEGNCLSFDGSTGYVNVSNASSLNSSSAITVEEWLKLSVLSTADYVDRGCGGYTLFYNNIVSQIRFIKQCDANSNTAGQALTTATWYHIAGTYDGITFKIYVNGTLQGSNTYSTTFTSTANITLGKGGDGFTSGLLDDVLIYNRPLSAAEISQQYNALH